MPKVRMTVFIVKRDKVLLGKRISKFGFHPVYFLQ